MPNRKNANFIWFIFEQLYKVLWWAYDTSGDENSALYVKSVFLGLLSRKLFDLQSKQSISWLENKAHKFRTTENED